MIRFIFFILMASFCLHLSAMNPTYNSADTEYPASMASGTIPIIYINTEDGREVVDKVTPIPAGLYMTPNTTDYEPVGSEAEPVPLTIRGRGNHTWLQPKKPYKLKFEKKISLFGLPKSKHYALMAHIVNNGTVWAENEVAFEMARRIGMDWAPHTVPVEFVLNGEYMGVYFLSETVKVDKDRVNIFEQEDGETDPEIIPYGWLVEIDNNWEDGQLRFYEYGDNWIIFTFKSPEVLSTEQRTYIENELRTINAAIHAPDDKDKWTEYIDEKSAAQYFIIREIFHDTDAYHGSFYLTKDKEENAKWHFGPLWDVIFGDYKSSYIAHYHPDYGSPKCNWIPQMMFSPAFEEAVRKQWQQFYTEENLDAVMNHMSEYAAGLDDAFAASNIRWAMLPDRQKYYREQQLKIINNGVRHNAKWINDHLNINEIAITSVESPHSDDIDAEPEYYTIDGVRVQGYPDTPGIYIVRKGNHVSKIVR